MYQITNELKKIGFSINPVSKIIQRNDYSKKFNTLDYFCIYLIPEDFVITVEHIPYHINAGHTVFVGPHKKVEFSDLHGMEVYVIAFSSALYDKSYNDSLFLNSKVFFNDNSNIFVSPYFGNKEYNNIVLIDRLLQFQFKKESLYISAAHNTIEGLILDAYLHVGDLEDEKDEKQEYVSIVNRYRILLQRDFKISKKVSHYAEILNITNRKLTEMTEFVYGKTAKQIIIEKIQYESEKYIKYSPLSLSEIAFAMGFNDEGNFTNFIKKHSGKKPSDLRELSI